MDARHVYNGICFPCVFDILYFIENNDKYEYENACYYAHQNSKRKGKK